MAEKDWKKVGKDEWRNDRRNIDIDISPPRNKEDTYEVLVSTPDNFKNRSIYRDFKTKSQALKFAKNYMRKY